MFEGDQILKGLSEDLWFGEKTPSAYGKSISEFGLESLTFGKTYTDQVGRPLPS